MKKNKIPAIITLLPLIALSTLIFLFSCGNSEKIIGICMPKQDVDRWTEDGQNLKGQLEAKGYKIILEYAEDSPEKQIEQIESMIEKKCGALIIAATDCYGALNDVLEKAEKENIKIIAYDRLIMNTENVDYFCTFDNFEIGERQGRYIVDTFNLDAGGGPITMEIFSGAIDDSCSPENYEGQMSVLSQYIENGKIIVKSGQITLEDTAIADWATENARARMGDLLNKYYGGGACPDVILSTNDSMAMGVIGALKDAGYTSGGSWPVITGMDCDKDNIIAIINGEQAMSLFIDTKALAKRAVDLTDDILMKKTPANLDNTRFENGKKIIPTSICKSVYVDIDTYIDVLVRSGYYSEEDLK